MRYYHSPEPIILSVGEEDEVSIGDVARYIAGRLTDCSCIPMNLILNLCHRGNEFPRQYCV